MLGKIYSVKDIIYHLLVNFPDLRDNDRLLMLNVWGLQDGYLATGKLFKDFAEGFRNGKYADPESIRRTRQKLQELYPKLQGKYHAERMGKMMEMKDIMQKINL